MEHLLKAVLVDVQITHRPFFSVSELVRIIIYLLKHVAHCPCAEFHRNLFTRRTCFSVAYSNQFAAPMILEILHSVHIPDKKACVCDNMSFSVHYRMNV